MQTTCEREAHLRVLADQLFFVVEKTGQRFTFKRTTDVSKPVCEESLTLTEAEQLLQRWKLRGFHGGRVPSERPRNEALLVPRRQQKTLGTGPGHEL